jgi:gluconate 2-dehydrogenase gamma chain
VGPGAVELGVVGFIDRRLSGGYGLGANQHVAGPFLSGVAEQGAQSALIPRETYRIGIEELQAHCLKNRGAKRFEALTPVERDAVLHEIRDGKLDFPSFPARVFLSQLFNDATEGYFSDPIHGGNIGMASWKMIGFPGPFRIYTQDIEKHRASKFVDAPRGIADLT